MTEAAEGVLLIHAFPIDARMWEGQTASLRDAGWVVARHRCRGSAVRRTSDPP